jgi:acyl carrier protein
LAGIDIEIVNEKENFIMLERLIDIIAEQLHVTKEEISSNSNFKTDLHADSLDLFELVMALEEEYDVEIPNEDLEKLTTVQAVVEYLNEKGIEE